MVTEPSYPYLSFQLQRHTQAECYGLFLILHFFPSLAAQAFGRSMFDASQLPVMDALSFLPNYPLNSYLPLICIVLLQCCIYSKHSLVL